MTQLNTVNTIETSSICDNSCQYCPAKEQAKHRDVGFMTMATFEKALDFVRYCSNKGTQKELNLFGIGEPLLNPDIITMVKKARECLPMSRPVHLNTNGNNLTENIAFKLKAAGLDEMDLTGHNHFVTAMAIKTLKKAGIPGRLSYDFVTQPNNWAEQVDWFAPDYSYPCPWLHNGQVMIQSNGDIVCCCIDAFATNVVGNVHESDPAKIELKPFDLCRNCHSEPPKSIIEV